MPLISQALGWLTVCVGLVYEQSTIMEMERVFRKNGGFFDGNKKGERSRGLWSHLRVALCIFYGESLRKYAGLCTNDSTARG